LRRFIQPSYCLTAGVEIAAFEEAVRTVRVLLLPPPPLLLLLLLLLLHSPMNYASGPCRLWLGAQRRHACAAAALQDRYSHRCDQFKTIFPFKYLAFASLLIATL
jgi:hypothetical protein